MLLCAPGTSKIGIRDQVILVVLYDTAIRADELIQLNFTDVNISSAEPYLCIHGKGDKERIVPLSEQTVPLLNQYIGLYHPDGPDKKVPFIYTVIRGNKGHMSERNVERIVKKYGDIVRKAKYFATNLPSYAEAHKGFRMVQKWCSYRNDRRDTRTL